MDEEKKIIIKFKIDSCLEDEDKLASILKNNGYEVWVDEAEDVGLRRSGWKSNKVYFVNVMQN